MEEELKMKTESMYDALCTLASAAVTRDFMPLHEEGFKSHVMSNGPSFIINSIEPSWYDVGIIKTTSCSVNSFYLSEKPINHSADSSDYLPDYKNLEKVSLLPGKAYKFRVAALNACGIGEWSDITAFKTCLPGFPGAPNSIRVSKSTDGACIRWEAPTLRYGNIIEYSVCLAIKNDTTSSGCVSLKDLRFVRVYCGAKNETFIENSSLKAAYIDKCVEPAIIFRIAARNEKGYGPATQVRWLQDFPGADLYSAELGKRNEKSCSAATPIR